MPDRLTPQKERNDKLINRWIDMWRRRRFSRSVWTAWSKYARGEANEKRSEQFCQEFYEKGLRMRAIRSLKLYCQVAGNKMYKRRVQERITMEVKAMVEQKRTEQEFLEALIKELEEKYRIELRKKAILKNQCDQAYLRGVSAISQEALKMSHSTLDDFYKGMKMPKYDGQNVMGQLQQLQTITTIKETVTVTENRFNNNQSFGR